jgi:hypothetical protein
MAVDDDLAEVHLALKKLITDPLEIFFALAVQGYTRADAGMAEKKTSNRDRCLE